METLEELLKNNSFNYNNPDHILLADDYLKSILNIDLFHDPDKLGWLTNYLIKKEYKGEKINVEFKSFLKNTTKRYTSNSKLKLIKENQYPKGLKEKIELYYSSWGYSEHNNMFINISKYKSSANKEGIAIALARLINNMYHELFHLMDYNITSDSFNDRNKLVSFYEYNYWRERLIIRKDHNFFDDNSWQFVVEREAIKYAYEKTINFFKQYAPELLEEATPYFEGQKQLISTVNIKSDAKLLNERLNSIVKEDPSIILKKPFLLYEYNKDGTRLDLRTLFNFFDITKFIGNDTIKKLIIERIMEIDEETFERYIEELYSFQMSRLYKILSLEMSNITKRDVLNDEQKMSDMNNIDIYDLGNRINKRNYLYIQNYRDIVIKNIAKRSKGFISTDHVTLNRNERREK
jgi:hypothetical protein